VPVIKFVSGDAVAAILIGMPGTHNLPVSTVRDLLPVLIATEVVEVEVTGAR
jgi:hypothetical protein